jgi:uncharacterized membrane protein YeaQ/YmgE (transglycosylase-associated protein family)
VAIPFAFKAALSLAPLIAAAFIAQLTMSGAPQWVRWLAVPPLFALAAFATDWLASKVMFKGRDGRKMVSVLWGIVGFFAGGGLAGFILGFLPIGQLIYFGIAIAGALVFAYVRWNMGSNLETEMRRGG